MPWLNTPVERRTTFIAPLAVGGLLGGGPGAPKVSKLQALASARKKKALEQKSSLETGMTGVDIGQLPQTITSSNSSATVDFATGGKAKTYAELKRESSSSVKKQPKQAESPGQKLSQFGDLPLPSVIEFAKPSAFAGTIIGGRDGASGNQSSSNFLYLPSTFRPFLLSTDAFAGPSPDDVVIAAQSKGSG